MHVRIAWEIYYHQKQQADPKSGGVPTKTEMLRPPGHLFPTGTPGSLGISGPPLPSPFSTSLPPTHPPAPPPPHSVNFLSTPASHLCKFKSKQKH